MPFIHDDKISPSSFHYSLFEFKNVGRCVWSFFDFMSITISIILLAHIEWEKWTKLSGDDNPIS